jgi:hypothetical protein
MKWLKLNSACPVTSHQSVCVPAGSRIRSEMLSQVCQPPVAGITKSARSAVSATSRRAAAPLFGAATRAVTMNNCSAVSGISTV